MLSKTIITTDRTDAYSRIGEFLAGLDSTPNVLLIGTRLWFVLGQPQTINSISVRENRKQDWSVTPLKRLMKHKDSA